MLASLVALCAVPLLTDPNDADPRAYGALGDGKQDDLPAIEQALASLPKRGTLTFTAGTYRVCGTIRIPSGVSVTMRDGAEIAYDPGERPDAPAMVLGTSAAPTMGADFTNLTIRRTPSGDWKPDGSVGLRAIRLVNCRLTIGRISGFRTGVEAIGDGGGFAYNEINPGYLVGNRVALALVAANPAGYCNENVFFGGRFAGVSDRMQDEPRYGVVARVENGAKSVNNNRFLAPCFELLGTRTTEAVPFVLSEAGTGFSVLAARTERCGPVFARETGDAKDNRYDVSYADVPQRIERGPRSASILTDVSRDPGVLAATRPVWSLTDPPSRLHPAGAFATVEGCSFLRTGPESDVLSRMTREGRATVAKGGLVLPAGWAIGRLVDTRRTRTFVVDASFADQPSGRVVIVCFDRNGDPLGKAGGGTIGGNIQPWFSPEWGAWTMGSDLAGPALFELRPDVAYAWIGVSAGAKPSALLGFHIFTPESHSPASWPGPGVPR